MKYNEKGNISQKLKVPKNASRVKLHKSKSYVLHNENNSKDKSGIIHDIQSTKAFPLNHFP